MRGRRSLLLDSYPSAPSNWASSERVRSADSVGALGLPSIFLSAALGRCQVLAGLVRLLVAETITWPDSASAGRPRDAEARAARAVPDTGSGGGPRRTGAASALSSHRAATPGARTRTWASQPSADLLCNASGAGLLSSRVKVLPYPLIGRPGLAPLRLETRTGTFPAARGQAKGPEMAGNSRSARFGALHLSPRQKTQALVLQDFRSRRSDSNRGPLHYERTTSEGHASTRGHARARSCCRSGAFTLTSSGRACLPAP